MRTWRYMCGFLVGRAQEVQDRGMRTWRYMCGFLVGPAQEVQDRGMRTWRYMCGFLVGPAQEVRHLKAQARSAEAAAAEAQRQLAAERARGDELERSLLSQV
jgi:hypothetical protein